MSFSRMTTAVQFWRLTVCLSRDWRSARASTATLRSNVDVMERLVTLLMRSMHVAMAYLKGILFSILRVLGEPCRSKCTSSEAAQDL